MESLPGFAWRTFDRRRVSMLKRKWAHQFLRLAEVEPLLTLACRKAVQLPAPTVVRTANLGNVDQVRAPGVLLVRRVTGANLRRVAQQISHDHDARVEGQRLPRGTDAAGRRFSLRNPLGVKRRAVVELEVDQD